MAYILSVNASIIADSGGACPPPASDTCLARMRADLVTATAAACVVACIGMGALANLPFALAVVLVEGLAGLIPRGIRLASAAGIGLFLAFVGLQAHVGVGLVGPDPATLVTLSAYARTDLEMGACEGGRIIHFHPIKSTMGALSFNGFNRSEVWVALATLSYVDVLDTTGTMYSMAEIAGFVDARGGFEGDYVMFLSSAGIKEGERTGLTALTVGLCFFGSMFFAPLLTSVPPWAVGPSMVMIGAMMVRTALDVKRGYAAEGVPAFVTMALMPLTYSIAYGIIGGLMVYVALRVPDWVVEAVQWVVKARRSVGGARNQVAEA
ncbi:Adenine/guanine permease AZG2 [Acorus calamus]|uniref:Adenine/guanine permease AZG2 n=1 Tax=Acorus calamus TaxID=4465 RepID=A0AAV9EQK0_ACOCL|nr:Adenine/guanine permease AZG2 [Acorus calamus]